MKTLITGILTFIIFNSNAFAQNDQTDKLKDTDVFGTSEIDISLAESGLIGTWEGTSLHGKQKMTIDENGDIIGIIDEVRDGKKCQLVVKQNIQHVTYDFNLVASNTIKLHVLTNVPEFKVGSSAETCVINDLAEFPKVIVDTYRLKGPDEMSRGFVDFIRKH